MLDPSVLDALVAGRQARRTSVLERLTERAVEKHLTAILTELDLPAEHTQVHRRVRAVLTYRSATSG